MVLVLCTLSDNALYLYEVLPKHLKGFQSYRPRPTRVDARVVTTAEGWMYGQTYELTENQIPISHHA